MLALLSGLTGRELPPTVVHLVHASPEPAHSVEVLPLHPAPDLAALREAALRALGGGTTAEVT
jgi:hypothetical protein